MDRAGDYCSTRELVLNQSFDTSPPATGESCPRAIGTASDEYTAGSIEPSATDIDHIFPLAAAWDLGAHAWDDAKRQEFANDWQFNLALTASNVNRENRMPRSPRSFLHSPRLGALMSLGFYWSRNAIS